MAIDHAAEQRGMELLDRLLRQQGEKVASGVSGVAADAVASVAVAEWRELKSLTVVVESEPYPFDVLPISMRAAVQEVQSFTKAPMPLVATCALSALSVAAQAHADVQRAEGLSGPCSLYTQTIAVSGERKSTCDSYFMRPIREFQKSEAESLRPKVEQYKSDLSAWEARRAGVVDGIKADAKAGKDISEKNRKLRDIDLEKPVAPRVPQLLLGDATPEALAFELVHKWHAAGVISSEAGIVLGGHAMAAESVMRNLAQLNVLWDGGEIQVSRRKEGGSFLLRGVRLTMGLQIQPEALWRFLESVGTLARGSGFLARFLLAWPDSTQGTRLYSEPPASWPALDGFNNKIMGLLKRDLPLGEDGGLCPPRLRLAPAAKEAWIAFHNEVEVELRAGGELFDVRDLASKAADNAARIAALFHQLEATGEEIDERTFECAGRLAAWHLNEARRIFSRYSTSEENAAAARLDVWLIEWCRAQVKGSLSRRIIQNSGPNDLRDGGKLDRALAVLVDAGRVRWVSVDGKKELEVRPSLLEAR